MTSDPPRQPSLGRLLGEVLTPLDGLRLLPRLPGMLRPRRRTPREVLVLPGWMVADGSTTLLRAALRLDGHRVQGWGLGRNTGDVPRRLDAVTSQVVERAAATGTSLDLVGWSLGGAIAREVARRRPDAVRRIVTLGTPLHGASFTAFAALFATDVARGTGDALAEGARERRARLRATPPPVPVTVVWSRRDGIVDWRAQQDRDNPWAEHVEVGSTHFGMTLDPDVLHVLRDRVGADVTTALRG